MYEKENRNRGNKEKIKSKMAELSHHISIITLNVNVLPYV